MWPFRRSKPDENLLQRVQALEARLAEQERQQKIIAVEWAVWFGKFRRLYAQLSKRAKAEIEEPEEGSTLPQNRRSHPGQGEPPMSPAAARLLAGGAANGLLPR